MAQNYDFVIQPGQISFTADPVWLAADESEVPGNQLQNVTWFSSDPRIIVFGVEGQEFDLGKIVIPDPTLFSPGEQVLVSVNGDPQPGEEDPLIILEAVFTAVLPLKPATHGVLNVTADVA